MKKRSPEPIPEDLLPKSVTDAPPEVWENRMQDLMTAAAPILAQYRTAPVPWWSVFAERFQRRLLVAAAAAAVIMVAVQMSLPVPETQTGASLPLAAVLGEENAATTLWSIANEEYDPVLALVILEGETP